VKQKPNARLPQNKVNAQNAKRASDKPEQQLLKAFYEVLIAHMGAFKQERSFHRMVCMALGMIFAFARHTVSQCILGIGQGEGPWGAWYRMLEGKRFKIEELAQRLLGEMLKLVSPNEPFVVIVDSTQTPHTSKDMPGCGYGPSPRSPVFARGLHVVRRWLTLMWLPKAVAGFSRAIPLRMLSAFTPKAAKASVAPMSESQAAQVGLMWLRTCMDQFKREAQQIVVLADGGYDTAELWTQLPSRVILMVRTAKNRLLHELPNLELNAPRKRGRPRKYGAKAPTPEQQMKVRGGWKRTNIDVRGRKREMKYKLRGCFLRQGVPDQPVFLLMLKEIRWNATDKTGKTISKKRSEAYYLVSAVKRDGVWVLPYPVEQLLEWAWQRWEIEVTHRDMKAGFGVGQMQCWGQKSSVIATPWCAWLVGVMMLSGYRAWGWRAPAPLRCAWWKGPQRWSFNTLWRYFRIALWQLPDLFPVAAQHPATGPKIRPAWQHLAESVLASARA
jgi:hypothetical protein